MRILVLITYMLIMLVLMTLTMILIISFAELVTTVLIGLSCLTMLICFPFVRTWSTKDQYPFEFSYNTKWDRVFVKNIISIDDYCGWTGYIGDIRDITICRVINLIKDSPVIEGIVFGYSQENAAKKLKKWTKKYKHE